MFQSEVESRLLNCVLQSSYIPILIGRHDTLLPLILPTFLSEYDFEDYSLINHV